MSVVLVKYVILENEGEREPGADNRSVGFTWSYFVPNLARHPKSVFFRDLNLFPKI